VEEKADDLPKYTKDYISLFIDGHLDTYDDGYFPTKGGEVGFNVDWSFLEPGNATFQNAFTAYLNLGKIFPIGSRFAIKADAYARFAYVPDYYDLLHRNYAGGFMRGRYIDQQIPFIGFTNMTILDDNALSANLDFRFAATEKIFLTLSAAYINTNNEVIKMFSEPIHTLGASLGLGIKTILGPLKAHALWNSYTSKFGFYLGFGYDF